MLCSVSALVLIRSVFRAIEYIQGHDGYLISHDWTLYVFDTLPMLLVMLLFYLWYPGSSRQNKIRVEGRGEVELYSTSNTLGIDDGHAQAVKDVKM